MAGFIIYIFYILGVLFVTGVVFLVLRQAVLWYWKINKIHELLAKQLVLQGEILSELTGREIDVLGENTVWDDWTA